MSFNNSIVERVFKIVSDEDKIYIDTDIYNMVSKLIEKYKIDKRVSSIHAHLICNFEWNRNKLSVIICNDPQYIRESISDVISNMADDLRYLDIPYVKRISIGDGDDGAIYMDINPNFTFRRIV